MSGCRPELAMSTLSSPDVCNAWLLSSWHLWLLCRYLIETHYANIVGQKTNIALKDRP